MSGNRRKPPDPAPMSCLLFAQAVLAHLARLSQTDKTGSISSRRRPRAVLAVPAPDRCSLVRSAIAVERASSRFLCEIGPREAPSGPRQQDQTKSIVPGPESVRNHSGGFLSRLCKPCLYRGCTLPPFPAASLVVFDGLPRLAFSSRALQVSISVRVVHAVKKCVRLQRRSGRQNAVCLQPQLRQWPS